mmetsp:Transcript_27328/g.63465  ORF Transcript_27328/g.63465 Transcript_27328/m.63465 type:complete len:137 (+) Transcript_27328:863-1273(+)
METHGTGKNGRFYGTGNIGFLDRGVAMEGALVEDVKDRIQLLELCISGGSTRGDHRSTNRSIPFVSNTSDKRMVDPVMLAVDRYFICERLEIEDHSEKTPKRWRCAFFSSRTGKLPLAHRRLAPNESVQAVGSHYT